MITAFVNPESVPAMLSRIAGLRRQGDISEPSEATMLRFDGTRLDVEAVSVLTVWSGEPAYQVIFRDVSAQKAVEANMAGRPQPGSPARLAFETFTLWDARWYMEIVRQGYPHSIPADVTYFQDEARAAFFPVFPLTVRTLDAVLPGGDSFAALVLNLVLGLAGMLMVGLLARRLFDDMVAERAMVLFAVFPGFTLFRFTL